MVILKFSIFIRYLIQSIINVERNSIILVPNNLQGAMNNDCKGLFSAYRKRKYVLLKDRLLRSISILSINMVKVGSEGIHIKCSNQWCRLGKNNLWAYTNS